MSEIKVNPEAVKASIQQMSNDLSSVEGSIANIKCEITSNTCKNVVDFGQKVSEINAKLTAYVGKFKQNITSLGQAVNMVEEMDKSLKNAIAGQSTYAKAHQPQHVGSSNYQEPGVGSSNGYQYTYGPK